MVGVTEQISNSSGDQARATDEISQAMSSLMSTTEQTNETTRQVSDNASEISKRIERLQLLGVDFHIGFTGAHDKDPRKGLEMLRSRLESLGNPHWVGAGETGQINDQMNRPTLVFGGTDVSQSVGLLDDLKISTGGSATIFARDGNSFVRICTNVLNQTGFRALGTMLAQGPVLSAIEAGKSFAGEVPILGKAYSTCYEPIFQDQQVIGILYFGFVKKDLGEAAS